MGGHHGITKNVSKQEWVKAKVVHRRGKGEVEGSTTPALTMKIFNLAPYLECAYNEKYKTRHNFPFS